MFGILPKGKGLNDDVISKRGDAKILRAILGAENGSKHQPMLLAKIKIEYMLNAQGAWQRTPLHWAVTNGQLDTFHVLVEFGANVRNPANFMSEF